MKKNYSEYSEQAVRNFMADLFETFDSQLKKSQDPRVELEFFGGTIEIRLLSFEGVYKPQLVALKEQESSECTG
ncbi:hypothetical protein [Vibrio rhizosphaerae]|uniref:Uncharacterized protein n=1 Tax=Vibrio rhizosphaerae TaxID=398736 RepID=A0ABU4J1T9_9VIBR|nr:hypothetical protein [Vibrio rhizosphaerae]MDW6094848.1 hypothetical protein [Vibrio rhizosphaerae]